MDNLNGKMTEAHFLGEEEERDLRSDSRTGYTEYATTSSTEYTCTESATCIQKYVVWWFSLLLGRDGGRDGTDLYEISSTKEKFTSQQDLLSGYRSAYSSAGTSAKKLPLVDCRPAA